MNQYPYENLNDEKFEDLVIRICKEILGISCKTFSAGKDEAKDSWFSGKASNFPNQANSWSGTFVIQVKHTKKQNSSCSDNDFSVSKTSIISKEIVRLQQIMKTSSFDNYILFTNRKLSGGTHTKIIKKLQNGLNLINVDIIGREQIDSYLNDYPEIAFKYGLHNFQPPLRFYEKDIRDVIVFFSEQRLPINSAAQNYITSFNVIEKEEKNELNNLSRDYFEYIKSHSLQYFEEIDRFLRDPKNSKYLTMYSNTVSDLQEVITIERKKYNEFEHIIKYLTDFIVKSNNNQLNDLRRIVRLFVHFMYFNCDIGKTS